MRQLLITAFEDAIAQIKAEEALTPLARWNESVFRFMYSRALAAREPDVGQFFECSKIDLVLHRGSDRALVEFKFYSHSVAYDVMSGDRTGRKGFPSAKNRREFENSVSILRQRSVPPTAMKLVALFYADPVTSRPNAYGKYY